MALIDIDNLDLTHPAVGALSVFSRQRGFLPIEDTDQKLQAAGIEESLLPPAPGPSVALRRAITDAAKGNKNHKVESKGKGSKVVYSILAIQRERIDLEESTGIGIADSEVSARIEKNGVGGYSLVITPASHPQADYIRERFDYHREHYKCSEDLSKWLSQNLFKSNKLKSIAKPGKGGGMYFVPKAGFDLILKIKEELENLSTYNSNGQLVEGVRIYTQPVFHGFTDCLDAMSDALLDDFDRACDGIESYLVGWEDGETNVRPHGMKSKAKEAEELTDKLKAFKESCGLNVSDLDDRIKVLQKRISEAEIAIAANS